MAYMYPYGDTQQLNLSWFLAKFKELYEYVMQLDPGESDITSILSRFTEQYSTNTNYIPGDYCIFNGYIYKANRSTSGNFDSGAWDPALPVNDVQGLRILLGGLSTDLTALEQNAVTNVQYTPGAATANGLLRQTKNGAASTVMTVDKEPTENSQNPVKSGAVYEELDGLKGSLNSVQGQITANIQTTLIANKRYVAGDFLVYNGNLYRVTTTINSGSTITAGTNVELTSVGESIPKITEEAAFAPSSPVQLTAGQSYDLTLEFPLLSYIGYTLKLYSTPTAQASHAASIGELRPVASADHTCPFYMDGNEYTLSYSINYAAKKLYITNFTAPTLYLNRIFATVLN